MLHNNINSDRTQSATWIPNLERAIWTNIGNLSDKQVETVLMQTSMSYLNGTKLLDNQQS